MKKKQLFNYYRYFAVLYCASFFYVQSLICFYFMPSIFTFLFELIRINLMCDSFTRLLCSKSTLKLMQYRKILLIRPGRIYGQKANLMGLFFFGGGRVGGLGAYIRRAYIRDLLLLFLFSRFFHNQDL